MDIPEFLYEKLKNQYGIELTKKIIEGYRKNRPVTFRVNTLKSNIEEVKSVLEENNIKYTNPLWSREAFILENIEEKDIEKLEIYKEGKIYLQSLSSMLPPIILDPKEGQDILDMTAAPGGKTTQIAALTKNEANITACEINKIRAERLKYNIEKQGANVYVLETDSRKINSFFSFDRILLDAPCSGSGTISLNKNNLDNFTLNLIEKCKKSQFELLSKALQILKPGQEMVYSTCSILQEENEDIILNLLKKEKVRIMPIKFEGVEEIDLLPTKIQGTICVMPSKMYEGFFVAKIRKE